MNNEPLTYHRRHCGASGYAGGELLRLLLAHPDVNVTQITSERYVGKFAYTMFTLICGGARRYALSAATRSSPAMCSFSRCRTAKRKPTLTPTPPWPRASSTSAPISACVTPTSYAAVYGARSHSAPEWLARFVYGLPELYRDALRGASYASGVGCNATATTLALWAVVKGGLLAADQPIIADIKVGSSEGGNTPSEASHHPVRSGVVRPFALVGHRHEAEVRQNLAPCGAFRCADGRDQRRNGARRGGGGLCHAAHRTLRIKTCGRVTARRGRTSRLCASSTRKTACTATRSRVCWPGRITPMSAGNTIPAPGARR